MGPQKEACAALAPAEPAPTQDTGRHSLCSHLSRLSFRFSFLGKTAFASAPEDRTHNMAHVSD